MADWRPLIDKAISRFESVGLNNRDWVWGGGTVLMLRYQHRFSHDVDLFLNDVQYLSYLSPRLSSHDAGAEIDYTESANHLRLFYPEGEIDFLVVAPVFPHLKSIPVQIPGLQDAIYTMPDKEILGQKLHYRGAMLTGRDLYDFVAVTSLRPELLQDPELWKVANNKINALTDALRSPQCEANFYAVDRPSFALTFGVARNQLLEWAGGPQPKPLLDNELQAKPTGSTLQP